jgi:uncharacterized membrane protein
MLGEIAASGSALAWGIADFCGGRASRLASAPAIVIVSQLSSVPLLAVALLVTADGWPDLADLGWGFLAGLSGGVGLVLLYRALAAGVMSVAAPITAVTAAVVPLGIGLTLTENPGTLALVGAGIAIVAIGLVSALPASQQDSRISVAVIGLPIAAGAAYGLFYALLAPANASAGLWPLVGVRVGSLVPALVLLWRAGSAPRLSRLALRLAVGAGILDVLANALYLMATYHGLLSVVAPIASLYPAFTVLLAVLIDGERLRPVRVAALGLATVALVLTHVG